MNKDKKLNNKDAEEVSGGSMPLPEDHGEEVSNPVVGNRYFVLNNNTKRWFSGTLKKINELIPGTYLYFFNQLDYDDGTFDLTKIVTSTELTIYNFY